MELSPLLEALLFSSQKPLTPKDLRDVLRTVAKEADETEEPQAKEFKNVKLPQIEEALEALAKEFEDGARPYRLMCVAGAWQFACLPEHATWIRSLLGEKPRPARLSQPALETLAIIAYRQPLTRSEMEQIRGVAVDGVVTTLVDRGLATKVGQADVPGRPALYGTTQSFLEYFGLKSLEDLPAADDLRRIPIEKPETLVTANPDLATQPNDELSLEEVENGDTESAESSDAEAENTETSEEQTDSDDQSDATDEANESVADTEPDAGTAEDEAAEADEETEDNSAEEDKSNPPA